VIADTEPLHLRVFQEVLRPLGIELSPAAYAAEYLGYDDRDAFTEVLRAHGRTPIAAQVSGLMEEKARRFRSVLAAEVRIYPGVVSLVRSLADTPLAVVSGALRDEVEMVLVRAGVRGAFSVVVAAEDVARGKPDPQGFLTALAALRATASDLVAAQCVVIEDSLAGIEGARRAGMPCLAVTNSYPAAELGAAAAVVPTLEGVTPAHLGALLP
jgi:beta-phosphoglucomutase